MALFGLSYDNGPGPCLILLVFCFKKIVIYHLILVIYFQKTIVMSEQPSTSRNTSTPKNYKEGSKEVGTEPEQSSNVLKSLLGVSPVMPKKESDSHSDTKSQAINDSGFVSMFKSPNKSLSSTAPSSIRGILRSSNPGNNSSLTLQQVIQRISGGNLLEQLEPCSV